MGELEASCALMPAEDNPYSAHALPLQIAQQMEREGRLRAAALAYEAAARVSPTFSASSALIFPVPTTHRCKIGEADVLQY